MRKRHPPAWSGSGLFVVESIDVNHRIGIPDHHTTADEFSPHETRERRRVRVDPQRAVQTFKVGIIIVDHCLLEETPQPRQYSARSRADLNSGVEVSKVYRPALYLFQLARTMAHALVVRAPGKRVRYPRVVEKPLKRAEFRAQAYWASQNARLRVALEVDIQKFASLLDQLLARDGFLAQFLNERRAMSVKRRSGLVACKENFRRRVDSGQGV